MRLLTLHEAAALLGVSERQARRYTARGWLPEVGPYTATELRACLLCRDAARLRGVLDRMSATV